MTSPPASAAARTLVEALSRRDETVATAESLTGGLLASMLTDVPGASRAFVGGAVAYATSLKVALLGVPDEVVLRHGVVSAPCAAAMAEGARRLTGATYALSTTGVAGPDEQEGRAVGTAFVGLAGPGVTLVRDLHLHGGRAAIRRGTCVAALDALVEVVTSELPALG